MAKSLGKPFETRFREDWMRCFPNTFIYRLPDQQSMYKGGSSNPCDFICFVNGKLHLIELKAHKGNTLPFDAFSQYERLLKYKDYDNVYPGLIVWFTDHDRIIYYKIDDIERMRHDDKKSVNIKDAEIYHGVEIPSEKLRTFMRSDYTVLTTVL